MNRFYNILLVMSFVVSNLGRAADEQEKRSLLSRQNVDTLLNAGKYYVLLVPGIFGIKLYGNYRYKAGYEVCESWTSDLLKGYPKNTSGENFEKSFREKNRAEKYYYFDYSKVQEKKKMIRKMALITPLYFGGVLAYSKYQESKLQLRNSK